MANEILWKMIRVVLQESLESLNRLAKTMIFLIVTLGVHYVSCGFLRIKEDIDRDTDIELFACHINRTHQPCAKQLTEQISHFLLT